MQDTTSTEENLWEGMVGPLTGQHFSASQIKASDEKREWVRQQCVAGFSLSPLYRAAAEKDPNGHYDFQLNINVLEGRIQLTINKFGIETKLGIRTHGGIYSSSTQSIFSAFSLDRRS